MDVIIQIFTGGTALKKYKVNAIINLLESIKFDYSKVIVGWLADRNLYKELISVLRNKKKEIYLWLPVFSEIESPTKIVTYNKEALKSFSFQEGENFDFYCPLSESNLNHFIGHYEMNFEGLAFDGVFLDKIRFPSFANGKEGVFSCFCNECLTKMKRSGLNSEAIINELKDIKSDAWKLNTNEFIFDFNNDILRDFFEFRQLELMKSIRTLEKYFRNKGMKVGYDLFAPEISYFTGQKVRAFASGDIIKPMYYRKTHAPAGMPFEIQAINKSMDYPVLNLEEVIRNDVMTKHLSQLKDLNIYVGIEINKIDNIALSSVEYLQESFESIRKSGVKGVVLSWDIMSAPKEHLETIEECKKDVEILLDTL